MNMPARRVLARASNLRYLMLNILALKAGNGYKTWIIQTILADDPESELGGMFVSISAKSWVRNGGEVFPGVVVERRLFLRASASALAVLTINPCRHAISQQSGDPRDPLSWDDLIGIATKLAKQLVQSPTPNEELYLTDLSRLIGRRLSSPQAFFNLAQPVAEHEALRDFPLLVMQFRLMPGAAIPYHDHRNYIGVLTVTEGTVRVRSFEVDGAQPQPSKGSRFQIRETDDTLLAIGDQSTLSRTRGNIHDLRAGPRGARFIDFFTLYREDAHSTYLNVADEARDPTSRLFDANWA